MKHESVYVVVFFEPFHAVKVFYSHSEAWQYLLSYYEKDVEPEWRRHYIIDEENSSISNYGYVEEAVLPPQ